MIARQFAADIVSEDKKDVLVCFLVGKRELRVEGNNRRIISPQDPEIMKPGLRIHGVQLFKNSAP